MTFLKSICKFSSFSLLVFIVCCTTKVTKDPSSRFSRPNYIIKYLKDNNIKTPKKSYVFILYTDRCQTCSKDNIDYIIESFNDRSKIFILNYNDSLLEQRLSPHGTLFIDPYDRLSKYGLNNVDNQIFFISQDTVQFSGLLTDSTKAKIEEQTANTK